MGHIYEDIEFLTGEKGIMTHMLPNANTALEPHLKTVVQDARFWDGKHDPTHTGEISIAPLNAQQKAEFWARYEALPSIFEGRKQ
jgi:hypothetical protein